jgi:hypothetical protein
MPDTPVTLDIGEMNSGQVTLFIGHYLGRRETRKPRLNKPTLNSAVRYFTGEFAYRPEYFNTPYSPPIEWLRGRVATLTAEVEPDPLQGLLENAPGDGVELCDDGGPCVTRPFRVAEKRAVARALVNSTDQRPRG